MKKFIANIRAKVEALAIRAVVAVSNVKAEGYVDSGVKILIAVVIGALLLSGLYALFNTTIIPSVTTKIQELFNYAETVKSDSGYTAANGFYTSNSGYKDELAWSAYWLYKATGDNTYLEKSKKYLAETSCDFKWAHCWDDVSYGTSVLLAIETGEQEYKDRVDKHMNFWLNQVKYTPKGLAWLDQWGALRYATTTAYLALVYADSDACPADKKAAYNNFGKSQIDYALGSSGRSYVIGYGENSPKNPHHRTAHGAYSNNIGEPAETRHILFGALVGGPDSNDNYTDDRNNYINNEVSQVRLLSFTRPTAARLLWILAPWKTIPTKRFTLMQR